MLEHGIDRETAKVLAQNARNIHSQIFIRDNTGLSDQEALALIEMLDGKSDGPAYEAVLVK